MFKKGLLIIFCLLTAFGALSACSSKEEALSEYKIKAAFNEQDMTVDSVMDFTYYNNTENSISQLKFNLFGNAYREDADIRPISAQRYTEAYPNGMSYGGMTVTSVTSGNRPLIFNVCGEDENILLVTLEKEVYPEEKAEITIAFNLQLANVNHRLGYTDRTVNLGNWFPILCAYGKQGFYECLYYSKGDPFFSETANYKVTFTAPSDYVVASSGSVDKYSDEGRNKAYIMSLKNARDFAMVLSKDFSVKSEDAGGVKVMYFFYNDEDSDSSLRAAVDSYKYFSEVFGKYPYTTLSVVQTGFLEGGMEYPALTYISDNNDADYYKTVIIHENAHQWWYATVGNNQLEYGFLDEGLAEYSTLMFYDAFPEYGKNRKDLVNSASLSYSLYFDVYSQIVKKVDTSMNRNLKDYLSDYEYANISYAKGLLMFENLRMSIGDEKFMKALKKYYEDNYLKIATPDDLVEAFNKAGADADGFFESWITGKVII